jgi:YQGE family putative transporter
MGGIFLYLSIFVLLFDLTYTKLLIYAVLIAIGYPMLLVPFTSLSYDVMGKCWNVGNARIEYIVVKEIFLNSGRIISILSFIAAVALFDEKQSIPILLSIVGIGHLIIYFFVRNIQLDENKSNEPIEISDPKSLTKSNLTEGESNG